MQKMFLIHRINYDAREQHVELYEAMIIACTGIIQSLLNSRLTVNTMKNMAMRGLKYDT